MSETMNLKQIALGFFWLSFVPSHQRFLRMTRRRRSVSRSRRTPRRRQYNCCSICTSISGNHTLTGQHAVPLLRSARLVEAQRAGGNFPAVFGMDFGFDSPGTWDGINFRQQIVDEAIQKYREGYLIVLMWHAVRPIEDEPVKFKDSIQGKLTDEQWHDLITPGTEINERWKSQVDVIAWFLKQLRDAHVPVLWRPYHEMNGGWFWWGQKRGPDGYQKLYRMLFDRLVNFHKLNNLIWVYGANEVTPPNVDPYDTCYPGDDVVDVLGTDIYHTGFARNQYDQLLALARGQAHCAGGSRRRAVTGNFEGTAAVDVVHGLGRSHGRRAHGPGDTRRL